MLKSISTKEGSRLVAWLKQQREAKGLTMRGLAERLDVPHSFVGKVEQAERRLDVVEYLSYCEALGVSPFEGLKAVNPKLRDTL